MRCKHLERALDARRVAPGPLHLLREDTIEILEALDAGKLVARVLHDHMKAEGGIPMSDELADAFRTLGVDP